MNTENNDSPEGRIIDVLKHKEPSWWGGEPPREDDPVDEKPEWMCAEDFCSERATLMHPFGNFCAKHFHPFGQPQPEA
jgi:hypothetical protein